MKLFKRHKKPCYCDFAQVVDNFIRDLRILADHIEEHDIVVDAKVTANQARVAAQMLQYANEFEGPQTPDHSAPTEVLKAWADQYRAQEDKAWNGAWDYVKENIRHWWD